MKRKAISKNQSRKTFKRSSGAHPKNHSPRSMRGGIRL